MKVVHVYKKSYNLHIYIEFILMWEKCEWKSQFHLQIVCRNLAEDMHTSVFKEEL